MTSLYPPIVYLENDNFDSNNKLRAIVNPFHEGPLFQNITIVLIQGDFCGFCNRFKPIFQKAANKLYPNIDFATIQIDQKDSTSQISNERLRAILQFEIPGVPVIVKFFKDTIMDTYQGNHDFDEFFEWCTK